MPQDIDSKDIFALELNFATFVEALAFAGNDMSVAAALDALRAMVQVDGTLKTQAHLDKIASLVALKLEERDIWTAEVEASAMWLLHEFIADR
jgi:hypothetical protein